MRDILSIAVAIIFLVNAPVYAGKIYLSGMVVDNAASARHQCVEQALKFGVGHICHSKQGASIMATIKHVTVTFQNKLIQARVVTLNYS
ncbi:MAG: hypothetical protein ACK5JN_09820 [Kluyvera sp.]|uniref:hypothetical protein n=1 Tax=Kluyvera sp. TaxID=1538228 RepID=UPI003A8413D4